MFLLGSAYPTAKLGLNASIPPILFGAIRMTIVLIFLIPFCKIELPNKKYLLLLVCTSLLLGQAKTNMSFFQSDKYVLGGFMNVDADGLDFELLANVESQIGLYSNIWLSQIDYYSNTDIQSNTSIWFNKKIPGGFSLDIGYSYNYSFSDDPEHIIEKISLNV